MGVYVIVFIYVLQSGELSKYHFWETIFIIYNCILNVFVGFVEEIIKKKRGEKIDNKYAEEIELFYSNSNCSQ